MELKASKPGISLGKLARIFGITLIPALLSPALAGAAPALVRVPQDFADLQQAIAAVAGGGVIEIAAGSYATPAAGFHIANTGKAFTIRAAAGSAVALDGAGSHPLIVLRNSARSRGGLVTFENLIFRHGGGGSATTSPGVTVDAGAARFTGCIFEDNLGAAGIDGGAVKVRNGSQATFVGCSFSGNRSASLGGALSIVDSDVTVSGGSFVANLVNAAGSAASSHGGAISLTDGSLTVSDALFQGNQAGWVGGAIYAIGTWTSTPATPHSSVAILRSTFQDNVIAPQACCPPPGDPTGGATHVEDQTTLTVADSLFVDNQAQFGGALDSYRALIDVSGSVFQGNRGNVAAADVSVGGAICALSNDAVDSSTANGQNPRPAGLGVAGSLFQGSTGGSGAVANAGGCILAAGDAQHLYGLGGLAPNGTLASNRAPVQISGTVFDDCDVQQHAGLSAGAGGAINGSLVALTLADSLVLDSTAVGNGSGGGLYLNDESTAQVSATTFAGDTADMFGGAIAAAASDVRIDGASFIANEVSPGVAETLSASRGAALFFTPLAAGQPHVGSGDASGLVSGTTFSQNVGLPIWDVDAGGPSPINTVQYNGNAFYNTTFGGQVYEDTFSDPRRAGFSVAGLNGLVVGRSGGPSTDKSTVANTALGAPPRAGSLLVIPPAGSPTARSAPVLAYTWTGRAATLNGSSLARHDGLLTGAAAGAYALVVDGATVATANVSSCTTDTTLCVASDRFHVQVHWTQPDGQQGEGHAVALSSDTGYFWFFDAANVELMVKVLDGRALNQRFWVFYGALSNVAYTLTVSDDVTGAVKTYVNPQGQLASVADTSAFVGTGDAPTVPPVVGPTPPARGACAAGTGDLCLGARFRVDVAWRTSDGASGTGTAVPLTGDTGYFWFFAASNVDLVVKVLDGRALNGDFWVFYGALSNVQYDITVTDTQTGHSKSYLNRQGTLASVADTSALPGP